MTQEPTKTPTQSVDRVLAILALFAAEQNSLSTQEIIAMTGLPQSTCFRLLKHLVDTGFLRKYGSNYGVGQMILRMAQKGAPHDFLRQAALPVMRRLAKNVGRSVGLNVVEKNTNRLCIEMVHDPAQEIRQYVPLYSPLPLYRGASGKMLWACLPERVQRQVFREHGDDLGTDWMPVCSMLTQLRTQGYCASHGERLPGASAVSVPLLDAQGQLLASLTISTVMLPFTPEDISHYVELLRQSSEEISRNLR